MGHTGVPDEATILWFRRLLGEYKLVWQILALVNELLHAKGLLLRAGTVVDAALIAAPSSTKNKRWRRDPQIVRGDESESPTSKRSNQWHFGIKAHIGACSHSGAGVYSAQHGR